VATSMTNNVSRLDDASQTVRLAAGAMFDGIKNGNIPTPAVAMMPDMPRALAMNANPPRPAVQRDLWVGHIFWIRNVSFATLNKNDAAAKTAEQQVFTNARSIAGTIEPFYGAGAKDSFFKLLAGHYGAVKAYLVATADGNATAQATATESITSNAEDIAVFLSKANPYLPKDTLYGVLLAHAAHHIQQILELKDRKYDSEARAWEDMKNHVYQVADATADALAKQFPEAFE
jgi:hypothetical protein